MMTKPWETNLAEVEERRQKPRLHVISTEPKGKPPQRQCPEDFDVIFVEVGRVDCENWYRASRITVNRWLDERGKERLIMERAAYIRLQRSMVKQVRQRRCSPPVYDRRRVSFTMARHAAQFLRSVRNGGWIVSPTPDGDWWVGSRRRTAGELLDLAVSKGFEPRRINLQHQAEQRVECGA